MGNFLICWDHLKLELRVWTNFYFEVFSIESDQSKISIFLEHDTYHTYVKISTNGSYENFEKSYEIIYNNIERPVKPLRT